MLLVLKIYEDQSLMHTMMNLANPLHQVTLFMDMKFYQQNQLMTKTYQKMNSLVRVIYQNT